MKTELRFTKITAGCYKLYEYTKNGEKINCLGRIWKEGNKWFYVYQGWVETPERTLRDVKNIYRKIYNF